MVSIRLFLTYTLPRSAQPSAAGTVEVAGVSDPTLVDQFTAAAKAHVRLSFARSTAAYQFSIECTTHSDRRWLGR